MLAGHKVGIKSLFCNVPGDSSRAAWSTVVTVAITPGSAHSGIDHRIGVPRKRIEMTE
jgi:hypothetical protein